MGERMEREVVDCTVNIDIRGDEFEHGRAIREMAKAIRGGNDRAAERAWLAGARPPLYSLTHSTRLPMRELHGPHDAGQMQYAAEPSCPVCADILRRQAGDEAAGRVAAERAQWVGWADGDLRAEYDRRMEAWSDAVDAEHAAAAAKAVADARCDELRWERRRRDEEREQVRRERDGSR